MTHYNPVIGDTIAPGSLAATELLTRVGGVIAGCGEAALAVILNAWNGTGTSPAEVGMLIREAVNRHYTVGGKGYAGQISPTGLENLAKEQGVVLTPVRYNEALSLYAGKQDIILGVSNARAFGGTDSGVYGHYITVVGKTHSGNFIVSDPNTPESISGGFVTYTPQQIANAQPFWAAIPTANLGGIGGGIGGGILGGLGGGGFPAPDFTAPFKALEQTIFNVFLPVHSFFQMLQGLGKWIGNPIRIIKLLTGIGIVIGCLFIILLPDIGAAAAIATGHPEMAPAIHALAKGKTTQASRRYIYAKARATPKAQAQQYKTITQVERAKEAGRIEAGRAYGVGVGAGRKGLKEEQLKQRRERDRARRARQKGSPTKTTKPSQETEEEVSFGGQKVHLSPEAKERLRKAQGK